MAGLFSRLFGGKDPAIEDATRIYAKLMEQARQPEFYGEGKVPDSYDGRIDLLTLHIGVVLEVLSKHGQQGERLSQAIYDVMRDDFEVAMREEGLSDTGIKRRIKPMMQLFFTRVKNYVAALKSESLKSALKETFESGLLEAGAEKFISDTINYTQGMSDSLQNLSLGQIALTEFTFPKLH